MFELWWTEKKGVHFCPADLAKYSGFVRCHFELYPEPMATFSVPVDNGIDQQLLDKMVEAIYSHKIVLHP